MNTNYNREPVKTSEWLIFLLLMLVPVFNFIKLIMVATSQSAHPVMVNYARAILWLMCISVALWAVFFAVIAIVAGSA